MKQKKSKKKRDGAQLDRIAHRDDIFEVVILLYYQPDHGKPQMDYIIGPFPSDEAAMTWAINNRTLIGKRIVKYELSIRPEN